MGNCVKKDKSPPKDRHRDEPQTGAHKHAGKSQRPPPNDPHMAGRTESHASGHGVGHGPGHGAGYGAGGKQRKERF